MWTCGDALVFNRDSIAIQSHLSTRSPPPPPPHAQADANNQSVAPVPSGSTRDAGQSDSTIPLASSNSSFVSTSFSFLLLHLLRHLHIFIPFPPLSPPKFPSFQPFSHIPSLNISIASSASRLLPLPPPPLAASGVNKVDEKFLGAEQYCDEQRRIFLFPVNTGAADFLTSWAVTRVINLWCKFAAVSASFVRGPPRGPIVGRLPLVPAF